MPKTVKYSGTTQRWPELAFTGKQSVWMPGQMEERSDIEAAQLLGTGLFTANTLPVSFDPIGKAIKTPSGGVLQYSPISPSPVRGSMMLVGNSIARLQRLNGYGGGTNQVGGYGWLWWASAFLGWPMDFILTGPEVQVGPNSNSSMRDGIWGWSGGTSVEILSQLPNAVGANRPTVLFVHAMENDPVAVDAGTITLAQVDAAYRGIIDYANSIGSTIVWIGCLPSSDYSTTGKKNAYYACEQLAIAACAAGGAIYVPTWDLYSDSSSTFPVPLNSGSFANMVFTNVHPMQGGVLIGARVADVLDRYGYNIINEPTNAGYAGPKFIHGNALSSGSTAASTGYTGNAPANTTILTDLASPTATATLAVNGGNQNAVLAVTAGAQTGIKATAQIYNVAYTTTGYSIGDIVSSYIDVSLQSYTNLRTIEMQTVFNGQTSFNAFVNSVATGDDIAMPIPLNRKMRITTPKVAVPVGTTGIRETAKILAKNNAASVALNATVFGYGVINHSAT